MPLNDEHDYMEQHEDVCPQCGGEVFTGRHDYQKDGGLPDCTWLYCSDCDWQGDPE